MTIKDVAGNAFPGGVAQTLLGFSAETTQQSDEIAIYDFVFSAIREVDQTEGALFLKRYLDGPQEAWRAMRAAAKSIPAQLDPATASPDVLPYLAWIVGWTSEFADVVGELDDLTLRRLIAAGPELWRKAGSSDAWKDAPRLLAGAPSRVWDWFYFRWILDESGPAELRDGLDWWLVDFPGGAGLDEYRSNLRIVDDGTLPRKALLALLRRLRPAGERIEVSWIGALDLFDDPTIFGFGGTWLSIGGAFPTIADGKLTTSSSSTTYVVMRRGDMAFWDKVVVYSRMRMTVAASRSGVIPMAKLDGNNFLVVSFSPAAQNVQIDRVSIGLGSFSTTIALPPTVELLVGVWTGVRVELVPETTPTLYRVRVFLDATLVANITLNLDFTGSPGIYSENVTDFDELEAFVPPLTTDIVGPEST